MSLTFDTLSAPFVGLDNEFPDRLHVLHHPSSGKYGCYCHQGVHGLACFSTEIGAVRFSEHIDRSAMAIVEVSFDEAREIAKARPMPIVSLMLLDRMDDPLIHYVR
jgi:hypothetical protein